MASIEKTPDERAIREYLETAVSVAEAAGPIALRYFRNPVDVEDKSGGSAFDPVTVADKEVESSIRAELERHFPDSNDTFRITESWAKSKRSANPIRPTAGSSIRSTEHARSSVESPPGAFY